MHEVYLYGSTIVTDSFLLKEEFPKENQYAEFTEHHCTIGGATGVCLAILSEYGIACKADGYHLGTYTVPILKAYFSKRRVDLSAMTVRGDFDGFHTYVLIDQINNTRNSIGSYSTLINQLVQPYNMPAEEDIKNAKCVAIDPFISDGAQLAAEYCVKHQVPYVTIDCKYDCYLAQHCKIAVISEEFLIREYAGLNAEDLLREYMRNGDGLYILTFGANTVLYGRKGDIKKFQPFRVKVISTWGAGDSFKCGCIYGMLKKMDDESIVKFACALAGCACCVYPLAENIPSLQMVERLIAEST